MAYAALGRVYGDTFQTVLAAENVSKAYALRNHTSERERFFITVSYDLQGNGKPGTRVSRQCFLCPNLSKGSRGACGGIGDLPIARQISEAIEAGNRVIEIDPDFAPGPV